MSKHHSFIALLLTLGTPFTVLAGSPNENIAPTIEVEEEVYTFESADNGSGPMWCYGNTSIVRSGNQVFASGLETIPEAKPLNNCLASLFQRTDNGWIRIYQDNGRTREPSPLAMFPDGKLFLSINPTITPPDTYSGPAQPDILEFQTKSPTATPRKITPSWEGKPEFTEHSYRTYVADGENQEMILLQNIGYTHAEWSFRDRNNQWSASGKLVWPFGSEYDQPKPIRVCYPTVALKDRQVFFCGVSDVVEPYQAWQDYKKELTGRKWDYDFRRLFFTWSSDITTGKFHDWVEVSSRDSTAGWISPNDLHVAPNGDVLVLWTERAIDERLREKFFPDAKQRHSLECAVLREGKVTNRITLVEGGEGIGGLLPGRGRFHVTEDGRLWVFYYVSGTDVQGQGISENRLVEILPDGKLGTSVPVKLKQPLTSFFTATVRAGCQPSNLLDLFGQVGNSMRYARIRLR